MISRTVEIIIDIVLVILPFILGCLIPGKRTSQDQAGSHPSSDSCGEPHTPPSPSVHRGQRPTISSEPIARDSDTTEPGPTQSVRTGVSSPKASDLLEWAALSLPQLDQQPQVLSEQLEQEQLEQSVAFRVKELTIPTPSCSEQADEWPLKCLECPEWVTKLVE